MSETILVVDDEEPVRRTFREWLEQAGLNCQVLAASDAASALQLANRTAVDLAILDWNLGAGHDGLQLLEDLYLFNPDVVAIMVTGFAHQATPLDAMRMGVRDYLDKNQDLDRNTFLAAIKKQLDQIRPAKRQRELMGSLVAFRGAVEKVLPLVRSAAALNDPVPLPEAIGSLFRFLLRTTGARDGVLLVRGYDADRNPPEERRIYDAAGRPLAADLVPHAQSVAGTVVSLGEPFAMGRAELQADGPSVHLHSFERGRQSLLAAPVAVAPGVQVVFELFDKQTADGFTADDHRLVGAAADFAAEMLRQALAGRQTHRVLLDAVAAALGASESVTQSLQGASESQRMEQPPPNAVLEQLRQGLNATAGAPVDADETLRLAEAVRVLALRHGTPAVRYCTRLIESLRELLDGATGMNS
jgi:two-component system, NtrC family, nitrogen regulation response regulator NtrX